MEGTRLSSSSKGVCPECGAPWDRVVEATEEWKTMQSEAARLLRERGDTRLHDGKRVYSHRGGVSAQYKTLSWHSTCAHGHDPIPALICDPFAGSCTSGVVATALGRRFVGMDLSREYLTDQAMRRLERPHAAPIRPARDEPMPLFDGAAP
jgi:hypothetical protein